MQRSYDYHNGSYSMDEYLERLDRIQRMPSMMGEYPSFPNVHEVLNNKPTHTEETNKNVSNKNQHQSPEVQKKVHFVEHDKKSEGVEERSIDTEADGFIQQKHKGFALCKWETFKVY